MIPHPSRLVASAEEHRQDLLAFAARERQLAAVAGQTPPAAILPLVWVLVSCVVRMTRFGFNAQPRPRAWTHA